MNENNKAIKTFARMEVLKEEIKAHHKNIKLLKWQVHRTFTKNKGTFAPRVVKYTALPISEKRFVESIRNLTQQIRDLEKELVILMEYGA